MGALAYNLLHMLRRFYVKGEGVRRSIEWLIKRLIKIGAVSPITPGSGTFTWPRPSRWPITTGQFSAMADAGQQTALILEERGSLRPEMEKTAYAP